MWPSTTEEVCTSKRCSQESVKKCFHPEGNVSEAYKKQGCASMPGQILTEENHHLAYILVSVMSQDQPDVHEMVHSQKELEVAI